MIKQIPFFKYQGTGNDFVIIDQFETQWIDSSEEERIARICDRKFGIGADGLIILRPHENHAFAMEYFNADGKIGSLCGNGSRCAVACMAYLNRFNSDGSFMAFDGAHQARVLSTGEIAVKMHDVTSIERGKGHLVMDTGSPHYVSIVEDLSDLDIYQAGRAIRYSSRFAEEGINVNFVQLQDGQIRVATYERGVEDETLSCGTGVTASALAFALENPKTQDSVHVITSGGELDVSFARMDQGFTNIWLSGPTELVFVGVLHWEHQES